MDSFKFRIFQLPVTSVEIWDIVRWNLAGWQKSNFAAICEMPGRADDSLGDGVEAVAGWGWLVVRLDHLQWWLLRQSPQTLYVYTPLYIYIYIYIYRYLIDCIFGIDQESSILLSQIGCHTRPPFLMSMVNIPEIFRHINLCPTGDLDLSGWCSWMPSGLWELGLGTFDACWFSWA